MPYSGPNDPDLPKNIKDKPVALRRQWVEVFNSSYERCQAGGGDDCEKFAFIQANGVLKKTEESDMSQNLIGDFLFAAADTGQPVEVLRTGTFVDRNGREVIINEADLDAFVANFNAGEAGQDVPVDIDHERAAAAGWIKRVWRDGQKLLAETDWNNLGQDLVGNKVYRYLSATIDMVKKVIKSVSLVNFPAVKGLKPVELSEGLYHLADGTFGSVRIGQFISGQIHKLFTSIADDLLLSGFLSTDERKQFSGAIGQALEAFEANVGDAKERLIRSMDWFRPPRPMMDDGEFVEAKTIQLSEEDNRMSDKDREALKAELRQEIEAELAQEQKTKVELREEVRQEVESELRKQFQRRQSLIEFANELCGGETGLSVKPDEVVELLEAVPAEQLEVAKKLLRTKVVDFREHGSGRDGKGKGAKLPDYAVADVKAGRLTVAELFKAKAIAGKPEDYDLSEFDDKQKGF